MRQFEKVIYGLINVHLESALHIGGSDEEHFSMAINGDGDYIIPGTSLAGVVKHFLSQLTKTYGCADTPALLGDEANDSSVYFYDAVIQRADVEERMGVRINHERGTAEDGGLYTQYYLAAGAKAQLRIQMFAGDSEEAEKEKDILCKIVTGIAQGKIRFGAKTRSGAGLLTVDKARMKDLDLTREKDLDAYLEGPEKCFADLEKTGEIITARVDTNVGGDLWILRAYIPEGLIVRSSEHSDTADAVNMSHGADGTGFYIPGTSIKGILRTYAEKVIHTLGIDEAKLTEIFGAAPSQQSVKIASHVLTQDVEINHPVRTLYPRIRVDRVGGGALTGAKMCTEVLSTKKENPLEIRVVVDQSLDNDQKKRADALVFLALRDLGLGLVRIGGGSSVGFGRLQGIDLAWNDKKAVFENNSLNPGDAEDKFEELLAALKEAGNEV